MSHAYYPIQIDGEVLSRDATRMFYWLRERAQKGEQIYHRDITLRFSSMGRERRQNAINTLVEKKLIAVDHPITMTIGRDPIIYHVLKSDIGSETPSISQHG